MAANPEPARDRVPALEHRIASLERRIANLHRLLEGLVVGPGPSAEGEREREPLLARRVERLARRLIDQERVSARLAASIDDHNEILRTLCQVLRELEDPYGLGTSLDERIGLDDTPPDRDGEGRWP